MQESICLSWLDFSVKGRALGIDRVDPMHRSAIVSTHNGWDGPYSESLVHCLKQAYSIYSSVCQQETLLACS